MLIPSALVLAGIVLLYFGGEYLIRYSVRLGIGHRLSPMVVGLTIVAFGTSAPELATALIAAARGADGIVFGNVVGSNIVNLSLILGLTAAVREIQVRARFIRREIPIAIVVGIILVPFALGDALTWKVGLFFVFLLLPYIWLLLRQREELEVVRQEFAQEFGDGRVNLVTAWIGVVVSGAMLIGGAHVLVDGAVRLAQTFGFSERIIGLSLVAFGTSLPELASCIAASLHKEGDIVLGTLVGSNIFNVLCVLGISSLIHPIHIQEQGVLIDLAVMVGTSVVVLGLVMNDRCLQRWEGILLVLGYCFYIDYLYMG